MSFWEKLKNVLKMVTNWLGKTFSAIFKTVSKKVFNELLEFAIEVCGDLDYEEMTNAEKRKKAFAEIKDRAVSKGVALRSSLVNLLIELAVAYLKDKIEDDKPE